MKIILAGPDHEPFDPAQDLRVLVAYLNAAFALRAKAMLERVGHEAGEPGRLIYSLWSFDSLAEPGLLRIASEEAVATDLIVVAAQEGKSLPREVRDWIARWLLTKTDLPRALAASLHRHPEQTQGRPVVLPYLARVARYGRMHFFAGSDDVPAQMDLDKLRPKFIEDTGIPGEEVFTPPVALAGGRPWVPSIRGEIAATAQRVCRTAT